MGAFLFEGETGAHAKARGVDTVQFGQDDLFERRLIEAQASSRACNGLYQDSPEYCAKGGLWPGQRLVLLIVVCAAAALAYFQWAATAAVFPYLLALVFSLLILIRILAAASALTARRTNHPKLPDSQLKTLTVLVPLYREDAVVEALVRVLSALDYPSHLLDIKLLVEGDDDKTISAIRKLALPAQFEILPIPYCEPRTKPKALNYGFEFAHGEYVVVFDAEDRPSPAQPREAMAAFARGGRNLAVVQAPLLIDNAADSWLAEQFELEYAIHFLVWLPFLAKNKAPVPLGGTSNYFRTSHLKKAGGWDAWNVTEDADLGLRIARFGWHTDVIRAPTLEEIPSRRKEWMGQRTRWMKGHLQTWLVANRRPFGGAEQFSLSDFLWIQLTVGGSLLASILHGPLLGWLIWELATGQQSLQGWHLALFIAGYASVVLAAYAAMKPPKLRALLFVPLYWPLLSWAMLRALWEMQTKPQFWSKTAHGKSKTRPALPPPATPQSAPDGNVIQLDFGF